MTIIILLFILAAIALVVRLFFMKKADNETRLAGTWITAILGVIAAIVLLANCFASVGTKDVGIETAYGHTAGELGPGIHLVAPWISVTSMDAAIQTDSYMDKDCLNVRVANQQTACVDISIRWRIEAKDADSLFQNYRTFENVRDSLVTRELMSAVNNQLANYNPLNSVDGASGNNPPLSTIASDITAQMQRELAPAGIDVLNTILPIITFDGDTQARINQLQQQVALTRIAQQEQVTNDAQAKANNALSKSVDTSPNVLVSQCLTILNQMVKNHETVPAGFSCWPGSGATGVISLNGK